MNKRLLALNLCLVLLFSVFTLGLSASNEAPVYKISVDGTEFYSNTDASGNNWSYSSAAGKLTLDGYNGSTIRTSGDLTIYAKNNVHITGTSSGKYSAGSCGVVVSGTLILNIDGTIDITGANNVSKRGGEAIVASKAVISSNSDSKLNAYGGNDAVAIKANELELSVAMADIFGGSNASAIYFSSSFIVRERTNAVIKSGTPSKYAITYLSGATYSFDEDVSAIFYDNSSKIVFDSANSFIFGDCNEDGRIDSKDAVLLAQYLAQWSSVVINRSAADTNNDGSVNAKDAVLLAQYLAKWNVELG